MTLSWKQLTALAILGGCLATDGQAQGSRARALELQRQAAEALARVPAGELDATRTKQALDNILKVYPPSLKQVLQLDYSLLSNKAYLAAYPKLETFLNDYPAVARNPVFFLGVPKPASTSTRVTVASPPTYLFRHSDELAFSIFALGVIGGLVWLVRATITHQRWLRLSKAQAEAQSKILERFTSNEDLLNFIQTPAGRHFLEASSMPMQPKAVSVPISQILYSMQIGLVLLAGGVGLELISGQGDETAAGLFHILGILVMAIGVGFILSGFSSYILSKKFGLLNPTNASSQTPPS